MSAEKLLQIERRTRAHDQFGLVAHGLHLAWTQLVQLFDLRALQCFHFLPGLRFARQKAQHFVVQQVIYALEAFAHADRPGDRRTFYFQHRLDFVQYFQRIAYFAIHLVDEGDDGRVAQATHFEQLDGLFFHALGGIHHHHRRIHSGQHAIGVLGKILVARCVEQVDHAIVVSELHHRAGHRNASLLFDLQPVGSRMATTLARLHRARHLDCAAEQQQFFGERGLARVRVRDDRKGAAAFDFAQDAIRTHWRGACAYLFCKVDHCCFLYTLRCTWK